MHGQTAEAKIQGGQPAETHCRVVLYNHLMDTENLKAWANLLKAWANLLAKVIWLFVVLIVLAGVGRWLLWPTTPTSVPIETVKPVPPPPIDWSQVNTEIRDVLSNARAIAKSSATTKLDVWSEPLLHQVDNDFLNWYFS